MLSVSCVSASIESIKRYGVTSETVAAPATGVVRAFFCPAMAEMVTGQMRMALHNKK